jgi:divalent metal cation (Fe/Co/Zn/Cd) transporter
VYNYGPNKYFASAHIEVDARVDVLVSHELVDAIEREFIEQTNIVLTGHLDPIVTNNEQVNSLREQVETFAKNLDESFTVHDFRMVCGEKRTNVLFDVAVPYGTPLSKEFIKNELERQVTEIDDKYCLIITVEHTVL